MAGKQIPGDALPASIAGMSKNQLYDIMSQMKMLIEQNQQQARQILIQNPPLTKALFQAQIMLGMVQPPQPVSSVQPPPSQHPQQSVQPPLQSHVPSTQSVHGQIDSQDQVGIPLIQPSIRRQQQNQPVSQVFPSTVSSVNHQSQPTPSQPLQTPQQIKGHMNSPLSLPQPSQFGGAPQHSLHPASQSPGLLQNQMPAASNQSQQPLHTSGISNMPLQPPLPPQIRQPSMPPFHHQYGQQMGSGMSYQHSSGSQPLSHPMYHSSNKPPSSIGGSFPQGQPSHPYQSQAGGSHLAAEYGNQAGGPMQVDRGSSWMPGQSDTPGISQLPGSQSLVPGQMTPDMEKALLQQVMSITPDQLSRLPPDQRNQVLQLQQILRQ